MKKRFIVLAVTLSICLAGLSQKGNDKGGNNKGGNDKGGAGDKKGGKDKPEPRATDRPGKKNTVAILSFTGTPYKEYV